MAEKSDVIENLEVLKLQIIITNYAKKQFIAFLYLVRYKVVGFKAE